MEKLVASYNSGDAVSDRPKRFTVDFTPATAREVNVIKETFGLTNVDFFRFSLLLMRIYAEAKKQGKELCMIDLKKPEIVHVVSLPLFNDSG
jgi:hypothetical protein